MATQIQIAYNGQNEGTLNATDNVAVGAIGLKPYEMVLGGLGACLNYTFQDVLDKMRTTVGGVDYDITGIKREEVPTILKEVIVQVTVTGVEPAKQKKVEKAWQKATEYCSMYETLSRVATMKPTLIFK